MRRHVVLLGTGRLAGVTSDAVVGVEIEAVLLVAIWILLRQFLAVDDEGLLAPGIILRHRLDGLAIAVAFLAHRIVEQGVFGFVLSSLEHVV